MVADVASMGRVVAAAKVADKCYNDEFQAVLAEFKAGRMTKAEAQERYKEIRAGLQEVSFVLNKCYDDMGKKDAEYQAALTEEYTKAPAKMPTVKKAKKKKATPASEMTDKASTFKATRDSVQDNKNAIDGDIKDMDENSLAANLIGAGEQA